jgi:hypothetical protein
MAVDHIRYDLLTQEALRGVLRNVLADAAKNGLPGEHHFYISFDTTGEGVRLSPRMLAQYPKEITIVLQHQFWDLAVKEDGFEVGLSFGGIPERLVVPFAAIKGFFDPAVQFGLQFQEVTEAANEEGQDLVEAPVGSGRPTQQAMIPERPQGTSALPLVPEPANPLPTAASDKQMPAPKPETGAEVVRLDRFRKK